MSERVPTEKITRERLRSWSNRLDQEHATPALLLGIGHDEKAGTIAIVTTESLGDQEMIGLLLYALRELGVEFNPLLPG